MKTPRSSFRPAGVSLLETVIAMGVLAIVIPLALAAMGKAGEVGGSARAETRAPAIADWCLLELDQARQGRSSLIDAIPPGQAFPGTGQVIALAFDREGELMGKVEQADYASGLRDLNGKDIGYLASISGRPEDNGVTVTVAVEFPTVRRAERRDSVAFHTILP